MSLWSSISFFIEHSYMWPMICFSCTVLSRVNIQLTGVVTHLKLEGVKSYLLSIIYLLSMSCLSSSCLWLYTNCMNFNYSGDTQVTRWPGIPRKQHGGDQVVTESTSTSSTTVISSKGTMKPDGTVSLKRDIIQGQF
jgi:hypothetical protein